jgi:mRNA-decapping enzyme subunit 2
VRFIINLPPEELESVERICFQVEEAQWFYEDFIRPLDPSLPSLSLRVFSLRIFQHCPLFSEWSADNYSAAFAEFLAYKSRVPVRGAIMLNEQMDQVVLVKGWKKGANWSFPRGKINKDEDDLDCAIREVYEETGFDVRAAGLIKDAKDMKYIEVTMREQHMRLYVFRGVPMDAHFEPRTRKEISKIEWYKLNDLPTLKKNKQQDGMGEHLAGANKFYMVAPFLVPLKKWISQNRKRQSRTSSQAYCTIPTVAEEQLIGPGAGPKNGMNHTANVPSDLPEVSQSQTSSADPSSHLKQLLTTDAAPENYQENRSTMPRVDTAKSNALLALLRKGSRPDIPDVSKPNTPFDQISFPPDVPRSPPHRHPGPPHFSTFPPPPQFPISPPRARHNAAASVVPTAAQAPSSVPVSPAFTHDMEPLAPIAVPQRMPAPYQRTGDPEFSRSHFAPSQGHRVPPASDLPQLTNHTRALLDVFKGGPPAPPLSSVAPLPPTHKPLHTAALLKNGQRSHTTVPGPASMDPSSLLPTLLANRARPQNQDEKDPQGTLDHRASLLGLFKKQPSSAAEMAPIASTPKPALAPVELAASSTPSAQRDEPPQKELLTTMLQRKSPIPTKTVPRVKIGSREGKTSATISGPLNQPQFEGLPKTPHQSSLSTPPARSPAPSRRVLFDPNQGVQKKILPRPPDVAHSPARSPRPTKSSRASSPKRPRSRKEDDAKPFQPRILRRPAADQKETPLQSASRPLAPKPLEAFKTQPPVSLAAQIQSSSKQSLADRHKSQAESHKQTLLSLFSNPNLPPSMGTPSSPPSGLPGHTSTSPHASSSEIVSPLTEKPISTRSRLGSLASVVSTGSQAKAPREKRRTAASDKAFLLGYLGRIAGQDG